jgi:hypothetical protein
MQIISGRTIAAATLSRVFKASLRNVVYKELENLYLSKSFFVSCTDFYVQIGRIPSRIREVYYGSGQESESLFWIRPV